MQYFTEIFISWTTQECDFVTTSYYPICTQYLSSGRYLRNVKNKRKAQMLSFKSGHFCLQEVVAYKEFQI